MIPSADIFKQNPRFNVINSEHLEMDFNPVLFMRQPVRSSSCRKGHPSPSIVKLISVIKPQDSILKEERYLHDVATALIAISVRSRQQVRSNLFSSVQHAAIADIPSSVTPMHLLKLISLRDLQLFPTDSSAVLEIIQPSNLIVCSLSKCWKLARSAFVTGMQ
jgi:hypothetical protein